MTRPHMVPDTIQISVLNLVTASISPSVLAVRELHALSPPSAGRYALGAGECKSWTLDSGLDHGLDYGLEYGLNSRLIFKLLAMVTSQDLD